MEENLLKKVMENRELFVPSLFTDRQVAIIEKYLNHHHLDTTEKVYFYSIIKKKMDALRTLKDEFYITGEGMIPERVEKAKEILKGMNRKAFISGSFLYKKEYNDIDIYVLNKQRKSYRREDKHFTFITEKDLRQPIFVSVAKYSVATFSPVTNPSFRRNTFGEIMFIYQWAINQILDNEDQKELRDLLFEYWLQGKRYVLDARSLDSKVQEIKSLPKDKRIEETNKLTKALLLASFSRTYTYVSISKFMNSIKEMAKEYKADNIPIFLDFASEVKDECRRAQA